MKNEHNVKNFVTPERASYHAEILENRLRKQFAHLSKRFKKQNIECFRLYDWDIPEVRAVVDWYKGHIVIAEYERLQTGKNWLPFMAEAAAKALNVPMANVHMKVRRTVLSDGTRYEKKKVTGVANRFKVQERDLLFWVNMEDFLDTGLFSDHRDTRLMIREMVKAKSFLNLFCYTGAVTAAAAKGEAATTTSVDRSETYIQWAKDNLKLNGLSDEKHKFIQSDVDMFLDRAAQEGEKFEFAFVDPPSFFQDLTRQVEFDVNYDHPDLLEKVIRVMAPQGKILFSTNHQRFEPNFDNLKVTSIVDITKKTIPQDYRNKQVHRCWEITV